MTSSIRRLRADEAMPYRELRLAALADTPEAFAVDHATEADKPIAYWTDRTHRCAESDQAAIFIAEEAADWLGLAGGFVSAPATVDLYSMWVAPAARGQGLGIGLIDAVLTWSAARRARQVELWVRRGNEPAIDLYQRTGFVIADDVEPDPADPCRDEIRMRISI